MISVGRIHHVEPKLTDLGKTATSYRPQHFLVRNTGIICAESNKVSESGDIF